MNEAQTLNGLGQGIMNTLKIGYQAAKKKVKKIVKKVKKPKRKVDNVRNVAGSYLTNKETKKAQLDSAFNHLKIK
jgi:hypothetical protein